MSDQEIRTLERQLKADPADVEIQTKLFTAHRRAGVATTSSFHLRNTQTGKYLVFWVKYESQIDFEEDSVLPRAPHGRSRDRDRGDRVGYFRNREEALKEIHRMHKAKVDLSNYQLVEIQTMTLEVEGPIISTMLDQIEMELLQAQKEVQQKKLLKLETEEKELLRKKLLAEKTKLEKLEAQEASLKKKIKGNAKC